MAGVSHVGSSERLAALSGFVFDLDGTIWEGPKLLPGAIEIVSDLRGSNVGVVFASNSSRHASGVLCDRLAELGIIAGRREMLAALDLVGDEILRRLGRVPVLPVGTDELDEVLRAVGHTIVADEQWHEARAVAVGIDPEFNYDRLRIASRAVAGGAAFYAVNLDHRFPVGPGIFDPGCGALVEAIAIASGVRATPVGKPEKPLFQAAIDRMGLVAHSVAMVGDSIASDIIGGRAAGMFTIWIDPERTDEVPDCVDLRVTGLEELHQLWSAGRG
jgi:HAD superfamily hydrolase (TIGR01450 family)